MTTIKTLGCEDAPEAAACVQGGAPELDFEALKKKYKNRLKLLGIDDEDMKILAVGLWDVLGYEEIKTEIRK